MPEPIIDGPTLLRVIRSGDSELRGLDTAAIPCGLRSRPETSGNGKSRSRSPNLVLYKGGTP